MHLESQSLRSNLFFFTSSASRILSSYSYLDQNENCGLISTGKQRLKGASETDPKIHRDTYSSELDSSCLYAHYHDLKGNAAIYKTAEN